MALLVESVGAASLMMVLAACLLGSWPNVFKVVRVGVKTQHQFLDFAVGNGIIALLACFVLGNVGSARPNFSEEMFDSSKASRIILAILSGVLLCLSNLLLVFAIKLCGVTIAVVLQAGLGLVLGTTINYLEEPHLSNAAMLFAGVAFALAAVLWSNSASSWHSQAGGDVSMKSADPEAISTSQEDDDQALINPPGTPSKPSGIAASRKGSSSRTGILVSVACGLANASFSPLFNLASNDRFTDAMGAPPLHVYTTFFYFSLSLVVFSFIINLGLIRWEYGIPVREGWREWIGLPFSVHTLCAIGGLVCGCGNVIQFVAGSTAGYAASFAISQVLQRAASCRC